MSIRHLNRKDLLTEWLTNNSENILFLIDLILIIYILFNTIN